MTSTRTKITNQEINELIRKAASDLPTAQPETLAVVVLNRIDQEDRDDVLVILLESQISRVFSYDRPPVPSRQTRPRSNSVAAVRGIVEPEEIDNRGWGAYSMAQRVWARSKTKGVSQEKAREQILSEDEIYREKLDQRLRDSIKEMAEINRKADIAEALNRRVRVRQVTKMLLDCTLDEVEWLANNATNVAIGHMHAAAFYTDIANRMKSAGATTVRGISNG